MGFLELITIVFVVLKLMSIITWGWFLVLLPAIISIVFYLVMIVMVVWYDKKLDKWNGL